MEKIFEFSIIIEIDNCQGLLKETVDSIINQSLCFRENIEIIFIYHESSDNSQRIIRDYKKQYPENIMILSEDEEVSLEEFIAHLIDHSSKGMGFGIIDDNDDLFN